jgi:dTDP-4-dehydrorhamnose reductase
MQSRVLVTGGNGKLAQEIVKLDTNILAPPRSDMDVSLFEQIEAFCKGKNIGVIIHAGAVTNKFNEDRDQDYIRSNIIGTGNVTLWCMRNNVRLVYVSSDYVYPSEIGEHSENAALFPVNKYAASKLGGEISVGMWSNSLIIRTSFYSSLNFPQACTDQFTSRIPIGEAAGAIYRLALMIDLKGIINLGSARKRSLFEIVTDEFNASAKPVLRKDIRISPR